MYVVYEKKEITTTVDEEKAKRIKECMEWIYPESIFIIENLG